MIVTSLLLVCGAMTITWICDTISESGFGTFQTYILANAHGFCFIIWNAVFFNLIHMHISGQGSSLVICVGILTGYTETLYNMLSQLSGM